MNTTEHAEIAEVAALLPAAPADREPGVPRDALLSQLTTRRTFRNSGWAVPLLTAAALVLVVALTAGVSLFLGRETNSVTPAGSGPKSLAELRSLLAAASNREGRDWQLPGYRPDDFIYVREASGGSTRESWYSANGQKQSFGRTGSGDLRPYVDLPAGTPKTTVFQAMIERPNYQLLDLAARTLRPEDLLAALEKADRDGHGTFRMSAAVAQMLKLGGQASPVIRGWVYDVATRIPGAYLVRDGVDGRGRHSPGIGFTVGGVTDRILVNPESGAVMAVKTGTVESTFLAFGASAKPGDVPAASFDPAVVPLAALPAPAKSAVVPAPSSIRDVDFANGDWELPLDVSKRPVITAGRPGGGGPIAHFVNGVAQLPKDDQWPLQFEVDTRAFPVVHVPADSAMPESAVVVIRIRPTEPGRTDQLTYAIVAFLGQPDVFPGPAALVELVGSGPGPKVDLKANQLQVETSPGAAPQRFTRTATGFTPVR
ncbi:hypothetical protein [Cryptosporangium phraense]|uniref:Uncharacterized protein n=1 Tax=Cryptosporangium phraense TaxID=2593070 RepID=A0A545AN31_9ACTN|nr:hypothetical protein [Cryptosporangium phraense]TQS42696.1 hypothetical protein FL583_23720 [Cryptosporangium phraense]